MRTLFCLLSSATMDVELPNSGMYFCTITDGAERMATMRFLIQR
jgi:hypothetical protein